jgi:hypothetical protein
VISHQTTVHLQQHTLAELVPGPSCVCTGTASFKMKIIEKINANIKDGKTFFSFEFFPPSEC